MNATLQCLRPIEEFREALKSYGGAPSSDLAHNFTVSLRDTFAQMDASVDEVSPMMFVNVSTYQEEEAKSSHLMMAGFAPGIPPVRTNDAPWWIHATSTYKAFPGIHTLIQSGNRIVKSF